MCPKTRATNPPMRSIPTGRMWNLLSERTQPAVLFGVHRFVHLRMVSSTYWNVLQIMIGYMGAPRTQIHAYVYVYLSVYIDIYIYMYIDMNI